MTRSAGSLAVVLFTVGLLPGSASPQPLQVPVADLPVAVATAGPSDAMTTAPSTADPVTPTPAIHAPTDTTGEGQQTDLSAREPAPASLPDGTAVPRTAPAPPAPVPEALVDDGIGLRHGPVSVPIRLRLPSIGVDAEVLGVGMTTSNVMDAPMGGRGDPVWQQAFWYRGSAIPGAPSTALIAGHIAGSGRPGVFFDLADLRPGDPIVVHDERTGLDVSFSVDELVAYPLAEASDPAVLTRIYGAGPVAGTPPQPSADGLSHLTLITCSGTFRDGTHDHRLVVYATRAS